jgi:signal transduction histidine kinase
MMSADASYEHMAAALRQGVDDFLPKPFRMEQLRLTVNRALQRQRLLHENVRLQTLVHLLKTSQRFSASLDPDQIAGAIVEAICSTTGVTCVHISLRDGDTMVDSGAEHTGLCLIQHEIDPCEVQPEIRLLRVPLSVAGECIGEISIATAEEVVPADLGPVVQMLGSQGAAALYNARLYAALAELDHQKSEFITIASHELRTPLSVILGYSSMLRDSLVDRQRAFIEQVLDAGLRINDIVDDLVNLRQLELGESILRLGEVNLQQLVAAVGRELRPLADDHGVRIRMLCARQPLFMHADGDKLMIALVHLVTNAIRFTPAGGEVTVICGRQKHAHGDHAIVAVRDTGIGVPSHQLKNVFDRFYQVAESRTREHGGLGVGLSIARGFVELHGGTIKARSVPGRGSLFQISLPTTRPVAPGKAGLSEPPLATVVLDHA